MIARILIYTLLCALPNTALAQIQTVEAPLTNIAQETRARALFSQLRCEVCEGQTLADSNAALAQTMRITVREQVRAGKSNAEILHYFVNRYGDAILMRPPVTTHTWALWLGPALLIGIGTMLLIRYFKQSET